MELPHIYSPFTCNSQVQCDATMFEGVPVGEALIARATRTPSQFWFHFNKPASDRLNQIIVTVHFDGITVDVPNLQVKVPTIGKIRSEQPKFVMAGLAKRLRVYKTTAVIE